MKSFHILALLSLLHQVRSFHLALRVCHLCQQNNYRSPGVAQVLIHHQRHGILLPPQSSCNRLHLSVVRGAATSGEDDGLEDSSADGSNDRWAPLSLPAKVWLPIQLALAIYLLLLLPSGLALGSWCGARAMGLLPYEYILFFSALILPRAYRYGKFAKPVIANEENSTTKKEKRGTSISEVLLFIASLVGTHWRAAFCHARRSLGGAAVTNNNQYSVVISLLQGARLLALILVSSSGWQLGKSYDRVTRPDALVTTGPYAVVRHPIYTAYLLLFGSTLLSLHAYVCCVVLLGISALFYSHRMDSEEDLLSESFGSEYDCYQQKVPHRLIPFVY